MYELNSYVMYGDNGVCQIADIRKEKFAGPMQDYYILKPVNNDASTFYVPVANETLVAKMRPVLEKEEIIELLHSLAHEEMEWEENNRARNDLYKDVFEKGDTKELLLLIGSLYQHKEERQESGKKLWTVDEAAMKHAEGIVFDEIAVAFDLKSEEVPDFITKTIAEGK